MNEPKWLSIKGTEKEVLVAAYDPKTRARLHEAGLIRDGEQHWVGGTADYFQGGSDISEPDEDGLPEDGYDNLGEHLQNQNF